MGSVCFWRSPFSSSEERSPGNCWTCACLLEQPKFSEINLPVGKSSYQSKTKFHLGSHIKACYWYPLQMNSVIVWILLNLRKLQKFSFSFKHVAGINVLLTCIIWVLLKERLHFISVKLSQETDRFWNSLPVISLVSFCCEVSLLSNISPAAQIGKYIEVNPSRFSKNIKTNT